MGTPMRIIDIGQAHEYVHCMTPAGMPFGALCGEQDRVYPLSPRKSFDLLQPWLQCPECVEYIHA